MEHAFVWVNFFLSQYAPKFVLAAGPHPDSLTKIAALFHTLWLD